MDANECRDLNVTEIKSENALKTIFEMQKSIQEDVYGYDFEKIQSSGKNMMDFANMNYHALQDEMREFFEALGGMDSHKSAIWKPWKKAHQEALKKPLSDLTAEELKELQFEWVDMLHFVMNLAIMVGLTPEKILDMYVAKNIENVNRQKRGY